MLAHPNPWGLGKRGDVLGGAAGWIYVSSPLTLGGPMGCCCSPRPLCSFVLPLPMVGARLPCREGSCGLITEHTFYAVHPPAEDNAARRTGTWDLSSFYVSPHPGIFFH